MTTRFAMPTAFRSRVLVVPVGIRVFICLSFWNQSMWGVGECPRTRMPRCEGIHTFGRFVFVRRMPTCSRRLPPNMSPCCGRIWTLLSLRQQIMSKVLLKKNMSEVSITTSPLSVRPIQYMCGGLVHMDDSCLNLSTHTLSGYISLSLDRFG